MLFLAGLSAGFIDAIAGGGGLISVPTLLWAGLPPQLALGTNKMQSTWGTLIAVLRYHRAGLVHWRDLRLAVAVTFVAALLGTWTVTRVSNGLLARVVPWLLLAVAAYTLFSPRFGRQPHRFSLPEGTRRTASLALQVVIALYGGYFGAGIGILTLAMLQILGHSNIHRMNAVKTVLTSVINAATVLVFVCSGKVMWSLLWIMVPGAVAGGYVGARVAQTIPPSHARALVSVIGFALTGYFFARGAQG